MKEKIMELLDSLSRKEGLKIIAEILDEEYDMRTASKMVAADCDSYLNKMILEDNFYSEGNEEAGFIELKTILKEVEKIINCDDYLSGDIEFECFVRPETPEETEENGHNSGVEWWAKDESLEINKLYLQFQV